MLAALMTGLALAAPQQAPAQVDLGALTSVPPRSDLALVPGTSPVVGTGPLRRFAVEVERGVGVNRRAFANAVEGILLDPRGWTGAGGLALQRVDSGVIDLRVTLARPRTVDRLCFPLRTRGVADCFNRGRAVINLDRWTRGSPSYGRDLADYRFYLLNHEVGHGLGHGHRLCPGPGRRSFVMMQQTGTTFGCRPQPWPRRSEQRRPLIPPRVLAPDRGAAAALSALAGPDERLTVVTRARRLPGLAAVVATAPPGTAALRALRTYVRSGGGLVVIGAAATAGPAAWADLLGGTAPGPPLPAGTTIATTDQLDPPTRFARSSFTTTYPLTAAAGPVAGRVLASAGGLPVAWCRTEGAGRVFADGLSLAEWPTSAEQALVAGGLAWAMGLATGPRCR